MQKINFLKLGYLAQFISGILFLISSPFAFSQPLISTLSLRIGPSESYPHNIELPSGSQVDIVQRRDDWLLIKDLRGESGWALLTAVEVAGGLTERQAWRLKEYREPIVGHISGQVFSDKSGQGWGVSWLDTINKYYVNAEYQQSKSYGRQWQSLSGWLASQNYLNQNFFYRYGFGLGYKYENSASHVLSRQGDSHSAPYIGSQISLGYKVNNKFEMGVQVKYLLSDTQLLNSSHQVSLYWALGV